MTRMTAATVVLIPDPDPAMAVVSERFLAHVPHAIVVDAVEGSGDHATRTCAALASRDLAPPLVICAVGSACVMLPAIARSQRSLHRRVVEYVLLDPQLPTVSDAWPDAPVTVFCDVASEASLQARLRGWDVLRVEEIADWRESD